MGAESDASCDMVILSIRQTSPTICSLGPAACDNMLCFPVGRETEARYLLDCRRHLAIMPHPERCYLAWQNPWAPEEAGLTQDGPGPWLRLFQNARTWAEGHRA